MVFFLNSPIYAHQELCSSQTLLLHYCLALLKNFGVPWLCCKRRLTYNPISFQSFGQNQPFFSHLYLFCNWIFVLWWCVLIVLGVFVSRGGMLKHTRFFCQRFGSVLFYWFSSFVICFFLSFAIYKNRNVFSQNIISLICSRAMGWSLCSIRIYNFIWWSLLLL